MDTKQATVEGGRYAQNAADTITQSKTAEAKYRNVPTVETATRHGTPIAHEGEKKVIALTT
jgi:hypothetical protein